ncbi:TonB-linked SusC/RagA family outer membrane protein [Pontibacter ummariensis]|uniref:TonB-linked outer membrane protein, SusC/RagA family n=1 Tax=Pontibacter ummariensis TaxID=1610492 RepID=A0A239G3Q3_9BACT|nr:SusC/RagA family TonB-linked outer membrane protein [Pontibacter ummariensis]PRY11667.1 TonB-linked SusC/RagA family outer membrane protein [Pontibacter ummariensis]SNS63338.1 TonB-linked outer membrane protein, SusC/RagA family [Pontibacter ummariensis]
MKHQFTDLLDGVRGKGRVFCTGLLSFTVCAGLSVTQGHAAGTHRWGASPAVTAAAESSLADFMTRFATPISGKVTDDKGMPLPGVTVVLKGTTIGAATGADGSYTLNLPDGQTDGTLVFSYIGYATKEVKIGNQAVIDVKLLTDAKALEEVVVVGYGTVEKKELTSAVTTVTSEDFQKGAFNSPLQMIEGKVAGVTVSNPASADPNNGASIQLRGASSLSSGNGPLIVIDGLPGGDLRNLAQQDIESISILRDAAAAAIYGSRGANGVVLVQTKRGKAGKVAVTYDGYVEHDQVAAKPDILSAEEFLERKRDTDLGARVNWYDELLREDNFGQNHSIAVSGGNENTVFRLSGQYRTKEGIDIASDRKEYGLRASFLQIALKGRLEVGGNISYRVADEEYTNYGAFQQAVKLNPTIPIMDPTNPGMYNTIRGYDTYNPVQDLLARENGADQEYSIVDVNAKLNILDNLSTEVKMARQGHDEYRREYYTSKAAESIHNERIGRARLENENWVDYVFEWLNNYNATIGKHDIRVLGGYSYQESNLNGFYAENANFPSDAFGYDNIDAGSWNRDEKGRLGMGSWRSKEKTIAFLGRLNYDFDDTYFLTGSFRYEGNTKFGVENKWGLFPAVSAAWRISNLPGLQGVEVINDLKLRASYGVTGRSGFNRYTAMQRYQGYGRYQNDEGEWIQVYGPGNNYNPGLRWEKAIAYNVGIDFALFGNKLSGSIDAFDRRSSDLISEYRVPVPPYLHERMFVNVGTTSSKGLEMALNWNPIATNDFNYVTSFTGSYTKAKLGSWSNDTYQANYIDLQNLPSPGNPGPAYRLEDNTELGAFYGYKYAGVDEDGNILVWKDGKEGTEKLRASGNNIQANRDRDRTYIGNGAPRFEMGWSHSVKYKTFDLSVFFRGRFDYQILNLYQMYYGLQGEASTNLLKDAYDRNDHIKSGKVITDYFLEDGDFVKLDNLTLGWSPRLGSDLISNLRIYGSVRNVFTITGYTGLDPASVGVIGLTPGYGDLNVYPTTRNFALGAQITF